MEQRIKASYRQRTPGCLGGSNPNTRSQVNLSASTATSVFGFCHLMDATVASFQCLCFSPLLTCLSIPGVRGCDPGSRGSGNRVVSGWKRWSSPHGGITGRHVGRRVVSAFPQTLISPQLVGIFNVGLVVGSGVPAYQAGVDGSAPALKPGFYSGAGRRHERDTRMSRRTITILQVNRRCSN